MTTESSFHLARLVFALKMKVDTSHSGPPGPWTLRRAYRLQPQIMQSPPGIPTKYGTAMPVDVTDYEITRVAGPGRERAIHSSGGSFFVGEETEGERYQTKF